MTSRSQHGISGRYLLLLLVSFVAGCGFHLAGSSSLPELFRSIYLIDTGFSDSQRRALIERLASVESRVVEEDDVSVHLIVSMKVDGDRILVSSASSGKRLERLSRQLEFRLVASDGTVLAEKVSLRQQRDIQLDSDNLHSSIEERSAAGEVLDQALFNQLIHRLRRFQN